MRKLTGVKSEELTGPFSAEKCWRWGDAGLTGMGAGQGESTEGGLEPKHKCVLLSMSSGH